MIAECDYLIVGRNGRFIVGWNQFLNRLTISQYKYDAWRTKDRKAAERVALKCRCRIYHFNHATGDLRPL